MFFLTWCLYSLAVVDIGAAFPAGLLLLLLLCSKSLRGSTQTSSVFMSPKTALKVCYFN